jgi:MFS family permease
MIKQLGFKKLLIFLVLSATVALVYQIPFLRYTFYEQMKAALCLTDTQMGDTQAALTLLNLIGYPIGGILASRFSTKKLICVTLAVYIPVTAMFLFTTNYIVLLIIFAIYGFFGVATLWSAYLSALRSLVDENKQSTIFGSSEATRGIIQTINAVIFLAIMSRASSPVIGYKTVMALGTGLFVIVLAAAVFILPSDKKEESEKSEKAATAGNDEKQYTFWDVIKNSGVWICIIIIMCAYAVWTVGNNYLTTYTVRVLNISESLASSVGIVRSYVIVFAAGFIGGWLLDKFNYKGKAFFFLFAATIISLIGALTTNEVLVICLVFTLVISFIANIMKSTYFSILGQAGISRGMTPLATGIISLIAFIPDFVTPTLCGRWLDAATEAGDVVAGFRKIFFLMIGFAVVGIAGSVVLIIRTKKLGLSKLEMEAEAEKA